METAAKNISRRSGMAFLAGILLFFCAAGMARAAFEDGKFSEREKVGFGFYKLAKTAPDFTDWVEHTTGYERTERELRGLYVQQEVVRLQNGFDSYDPAQHPIRMMLPARIIFPPKPERAEIELKKQDIPVEITLKNFEEGFLPFQLGKTWVALVPGDLASHSSFYLTPPEFRTLADSLKMDLGARQWQVKLEIVMVPTVVNLEQPLTRKGLSLWQMEGEIGFIAIWLPGGKQKRYAWKVHQAEWYKGNEEEPDLLDLYRH